MSLSYVKSSKLHLDNSDKFLRITRELHDCTTTDSCYLHLSQKSASLIVPSMFIFNFIFNFLEILFKYSSAIRPKSRSAQKPMGYMVWWTLISIGVGHILSSFFALASLTRSLICWQLILGCRKNVGEPYKQTDKQTDRQTDRQTLQPLTSTGGFACTL